MSSVHNVSILTNLSQVQRPLRVNSSNIKFIKIDAAVGEMLMLTGRQAGRQAGMTNINTRIFATTVETTCITRCLEQSRPASSEATRS
jgi:hypothetical protein